MSENTTDKITMGEEPYIAYRPDIDGLRGFAILFVIAYHAFPNWVGGGFVGVDVFFVISGFLISSIIFRRNGRGDFRFAEFYMRRIRRLFPALVLVLAVTLILGWIYLLPDEFKELGRQIATGAGFIQNFTLRKDFGYFATASELRPLLHLWSLAVEEQFYLLYPVAVWALWPRRGTLLRAVVLTACVSFALNILLVHRHPPEAFYMLHTRLWELLAGGILAYVPHHNGPVRALSHRQRDIAATLGTVLILTAVVFLDKNKAFPGWWALLPVSGTSLLILAGPSSWINRVILGAPAINFTGRISYPLYLWHWPILSFARILDPAVTAGTRAGFLVLSFFLAWFTYQFVEKPIRFGNWPRRTPVMAAVSTMFAIGVGGLFIYLSQGVPSRLPKPLRKIATYQYDHESVGGYHKCWLDGSQAIDGFAPACYDRLLAGDGSGTVVVWGDSHAGCLSPGVRSIWGDRWGVSEFARDNCPPLLDGVLDPTSKCGKNNQLVASRLKKHPLATVILFGDWPKYTSDWTAGSPYGKTLLATIRKLHDAGVSHIIVMGPSPQWKDKLPKLILIALEKQWRNSTVPSRMIPGLKASPEIVDRQMRTLLAGSQTTYFSVFDTLCSKEGCLVRTSDRQTSFTTWDYGHLTFDGSCLVASRLPLALPSPPLFSHQRSK